MSAEPDAPVPFRIKTVEPIERLTRAEREARIEAAGYNPFLLDADDVYVDLLTDSGTGAMSADQWGGGMMQGDESYAGSKSFRSLKDAIQDVLGFDHLIPCHQGRGAENVVCTTLLEEGDIVVGNAPFDTTRAHIEQQGARVIDCTSRSSRDLEVEAPFKGNVDLDALQEAIERHEDVALLLVTVTCNSVGGQPVSLANLRAVAKHARSAGIPVLLDAARIAENAYFIQQREQGEQTRTVRVLVQEMTSLADGVLFSAKKNALVNIGGFIATREKALYDRLVPNAILYEGFPTYGGLAGRDLEAMAVGLREGVEEPFLAHRVGQVAYLHRRLDAAGIPLLRPAGGHAVYIDALRFLDHLDREALPGQTLAVELYVEGGVRGVEIGAVMAGRDPDTGENRWPANEYLRLAIPARTYTRAHLDHVVDALEKLWERRDELGGYTFQDEVKTLRHFTSTFEPAT